MNAKWTRKDRVLAYLKAGNWIAAHVLTRPDVGGSEGLRRVRELRAEGLEIEVRTMPKSYERQYRLKPVGEAA